MKIKKHIVFLQSDPKAEILFLIDKSLKKAIKTICSTIANCKMYFWGIKCGKNLTVNGNIIIFKHANSRIKIGNKCTFNSLNHYNYRGINHCCILQTGAENAEINIGDNCGFSGVSIISKYKVTIGNHVNIGANSAIGDCDDHPDLYKTKPAPILIKDNVWIGMNVIILKGVTIGENTVIGAGSIVTKDIPANVVAAGNPCKVIKQRNL